MWQSQDDLRSIIEENKNLKLLILLNSKIQRGDICSSSKANEALKTNYSKWVTALTEIEAYLEETAPFNGPEALEVSSQFRMSSTDVADYLSKHFFAIEVTNSKRGPKEYPIPLAAKLYRILEQAKGDSKKINILVEYFSPEGVFDKWVRRTSNNYLRGPSRKSLDNEIFDKNAGRIWLNDFKGRLTNQLRRYLSAQDDLHLKQNGE